MTKWIDGVPTTQGIYWVDAGFGIVLVARVGTESYVYGHGGSFPLRETEQFKYALIKLPTKWSELKNPSDCGKGKAHAWLKSPEGYTGLGLIYPDAHGLVGSVIWYDHPTLGSTHGAWIRPTDKYMFHRVRAPKPAKVRKV